MVIYGLGMVISEYKHRFILLSV